MKNQLKFRSRKIEGEAHGRFSVSILALLVIVCRLTPFLIFVAVSRPDLLPGWA